MKDYMYMINCEAYYVTRYAGHNNNVGNIVTIWAGGTWELGWDSKSPGPVRNSSHPC